MSNYTKSTNFAAKDALASGNAAKIVKGTEIDTEFNNIATAVATKADSANPTFTGSFSLPSGTTGVTASSGDNSTALATTAFVQTALQLLHPVGSIYINATSSTNPATLLGFGTWTAFGAGRVLVGFDSSDALFNSAEKTGGSKDAVVVSHTHTGTTSTAAAHSHSSAAGPGPGSPNLDPVSANTQQLAVVGNTTGSGGAHNHTFTTDASGSSGTNANIQPYITVYMWKRTV